MKDSVTRKRKAVDDEIQSLKRRKLEMSTNIDSLTASADQLAEKAENSRDSVQGKDCWNDRTGQAVGRQASWAEKLNKF